MTARGMHKLGCALFAVFLAGAIPMAVMAETTVKMGDNWPPSLEDNAVHAYATTFKELV